MTEILTEIIDNIDIKPSYNPKLKGAFKIGRRLLKNLWRQQMTMTSAYKFLSETKAVTKTYNKNMFWIWLNSCGINPERWLSERSLQGKIMKHN